MNDNKWHQQRTQKGSLIKTFNDQIPNPQNNKIVLK